VLCAENREIAVYTVSVHDRERHGSRGTAEVLVLPARRVLSRAYLARRRTGSIASQQAKTSGYLADCILVVDTSKWFLTAFSVRCQ
jgi:hypothetical protein